MTMAFPRSYNDPLYAALAATMEQRFNLPHGILDAIRTRGEKSNADQVSSAGARTPYQFIPSTRRGMIKNYGVDPYAGPEDATIAAGQLLKENYGRFHNWDDAVMAYHGGLNRKNWGPRTTAYGARVGSIPEGDLVQEHPQMASIYDGPDIPGSFDPHYEATKNLPVPIPGDAGPSQNVPATSPVAKKKRGGVLGAIGGLLENIFMPEPDSLYAAALRGGIWDAKANRDKYRSEAAMDEIAKQEANLKLHQMMTNGEYKVVGNNVAHFPSNGGPPEIIAPPQTPGEKERLIDRWSKMDANDPAKELIERMLLGGNSDEVLANRESTAQIRARATTGSAQIRANATGKAGAPKYEYKIVNGKLMRRRVD